MLVVLDHLGLHGSRQGEDLAEVVEEGDDLGRWAGSHRLAGGGAGLKQQWSSWLGLTPPATTRDKWNQRHMTHGT